MRLAEFIAGNMESILAAWERFASTRQPAASDMTSLELRDHAQQILEAIRVDLGTEQTREQQADKSQGRAPAPFPARETAAQAHAVLRARSGFDMRQLASEYRALRSSVLTLWMDALGSQPPHLDDVIRFNEAIDQALAESIGHFTAQVERSRNLLLGMLSHDMRSPLQTIRMTAAYLARLDAGEAVSAAARRLIDSGARVQSLVDDLTDFNRTNLGLGISVVRAPVDLAVECATEVASLHTAHPDREIDLSVRGDCRGDWDGRRVQQLVCNLVSNALTHGAASSAVHVSLVGSESGVRIAVGNACARIPDAILAQIFEPLRRGPQATAQPGLGLGLYIVREIARAHDGTVEACSTDEVTTFTAWLPKHSESGAALPS
jgi:signal transduction histidine kinase